MTTSRRWRDDRSSTLNKNNFNWIKLGGMTLAGLMCIKFLFYTEPVSLKDDRSFTNKTMAEFRTAHGRFTIELFPDRAPQTVAHFKHLIESRFYTSNAGFYRKEDGHLLQAGGFIHDKMIDGGDLAIPVEYSLPAVERAVVLARQKQPDSGSSEFAIMLRDNSLTNQPSTVDHNPGYTTFGHVYRGWNTIQRIAENMTDGFLKKENHADAIAFQDAQLIDRVAPTKHNLREALSLIYDYIETPYSVVIFSKTTCPFCKQAKKIFQKELQAELRIIEIDLLPNGPDYQECLAAITGRRTVPNVFINEQSIGGGDETDSLFKTGRLKKMVFKSGALAKSEILKAITSNPVVVFSKSTCPFCMKAKNAIKDLGAQMKVFELDHMQDGNAIQYYLFMLTGRKTVPNVFINGKSIGGGDDVERMAKSGELKVLLQRVGALN